MVYPKNSGLLSWSLCLFSWFTSRTLVSSTEDYAYVDGLTKDFWFLLLKLMLTTRAMFSCEVYAYIDGLTKELWFPPLKFMLVLFVYPKNSGFLDWRLCLCWWFTPKTLVSSNESHADVDGLLQELCCPWLEYISTFGVANAHCWLVANG